MSAPRRVAEGTTLHAPDGVREQAPRRAVARRSSRDLVLSSALTLAVAAGVGSLVLTSGAGVGYAAQSAATPIAAVSQASATVATEEAFVNAIEASDALELTSARKMAGGLAASAKAAEDAASKAAEATAAAAKASKAVSPLAKTGNFAPASKYGLKGGAVKTYNVVMSNFSGINSVGGYRASSLSNHQLGLAIDFMITPGAESPLGWSIAKYLAAHASELNIDHIIFEQHIWTPRTPTWRLMEDRGSVTANHFNHVHVSMKS